MAGTGRRPPPPTPPPSHAGLGRVQDEPTRSVLRVHGDRLSTLERRLTELEAVAVQVGSPVSAYRQRITELADPARATDAVNLRTLRREILRATIGPAPAPAATPPPPTPTGSGLRALGRGFARDGVRWDWRGMTAFTLLWRLLNDVVATGTLDFCQSQGVRVPRILLSMKSGFWTSRSMYLDPAEYSDYWPTLGQLVDLCEARQLTPQLVIFGDCEEIYTSAGQRLTFVQAVANWMKGRNPAVFIEIANEPPRIGISNAEVQALAEAYAAIDPTRMVTPGPSFDTEGGNLRFNRPPATYLTFHASRDTEPTVWQWVLLHYGYGPVTQSDRPSVSNEPINAGTSTLGSWDDGRDRWYAFGALGRILQFSTTFHFEDGIFGNTPAGTDAEPCFAAWKQGQDDISFDLPGQVFARNVGGSAGDDPLTGLGGAQVYVGKHDGASGQLIVMDAPSGWAPSPATGWAAEIVYSLDDCRRVRVVRS